MSRILLDLKLYLSSANIVMSHPCGLMFRNECMSEMGRPTEGATWFYPRCLLHHSRFHRSGLGGLRNLSVQSYKQSELLSSTTFSRLGRGRPGFISDTPGFLSPVQSAGICIRSDEGTTGAGANLQENAPEGFAQL